MELQDFNAWWRSGTISRELTGRKRRIFAELIKYVDKLLGPRKKSRIWRPETADMRGPNVAHREPNRATPRTTPLQR